MSSNRARVNKRKQVERTGHSQTAIPPPLKIPRGIEHASPPCSPFAQTGARSSPNHGHGHGAEFDQHVSSPWKYIKDGEKAHKCVNALKDETKARQSEKRTTGSFVHPCQRDVVGANPLHLAVLYSCSNSKPPSLDKQAQRLNKRSLGWQEMQEHEQIALKIWETAELSHFRTQSYDRADYEVD